VPAVLSDRDRRILEGPNFASVATSMPDGSPHVSTIWIDLDGDVVVFNTAEGLTKIENMRRDPRVAISVFDGADPYEQVVVRGTVAEITPDGADAHIDALARKYLGVDQYPWREAGEQRLIVRIRPEHVSSG
jgi:PPOX class probable F420-dependent enzyme